MLRYLGLVDHERGLAVCHKTPVLHRTHGELRDADHVELGQGVRHLRRVIVMVRDDAQMNKYHDSKHEHPWMQLSSWQLVQQTILIQRCVWFIQVTRRSKNIDSIKKNIQ